MDLELEVEELELIDTPKTTYDADATQRYEFSVIENGEKFDSAHIFKPLSDERYLQYAKSIKAEGNADDTDSNELEKACELWDDLIESVENLETDGDDFRKHIDFAEKTEMLQKFLAVAIYEPETASNGKRRGVSKHVKVITECYFNYEPIRQTHVLEIADKIELAKKYEKIKSKQFQSEQVRGLNKLKPKLKFVPQTEKFAELYDEIFVSAEGFKNNRIPMRFKIRVLDYLLSPTIDPKK